MNGNFIRRVVVGASGHFLGAGTSYRLALSSSIAFSRRFQSTTESNGGVESPSVVDPTIELKPSPPKASTVVSKYTYRCSINDPLRHDREHLGKFYQIDPKEMSILDPFKDNLRLEFYEESKAFNETCLMIREPALEIMNYLRTMDLSQPAVKFVLYGSQDGTGKRSTLFHLIHYCYKDNWLLINLGNCSKVLRFNGKENKQESKYKEDRWDTPIEAIKFIKRFSNQNMPLLKKLNLKTTKKYTWDSRESTDKDTPIIDLFELAESKAKFSSDICAAIIREIKLQNKDKNFKVLVTMDHLNSYFGPTRLKRNDKSETNAVIIGIICNIGVIKPAPNLRTKFYDMSIPWQKRRRVECELHYDGPLMPIDLLKEHGIRYLEPFVPIEVPKYSIPEATNQLEYYKDRNWVQSPQTRTDEGREEIFFLSSRNPAQFMRVCQTI